MFPYAVYRRGIKNRDALAGGNVASFLINTTGLSEPWVSPDFDCISVNPRILRENKRQMTSQYSHGFLSIFFGGKYSSNEIRKAQNEHLNIICQNLNGESNANFITFWGLYPLLSDVKTNGVS